MLLSPPGLVGGLGDGDELGLGDGETATNSGSGTAMATDSVTGSVKGLGLKWLGFPVLRSGRDRFGDDGRARSYARGHDRIPPERRRRRFARASA